MATVETITTAEELYRDAGKLGRCELIRGEIIRMNPAGLEHGWASNNISAPLHEFVKRNQLGIVLAAETGFFISRSPDTVRAADVAFLRRDRIPQGRHPKFFEGAPDLAVEVVSPNDRINPATVKMREWFDAGCRSVWIVDPANRSVVVYQPDGVERQFNEQDVVVDPLLPGFSLAVSEIFPW